MNNNLDNLYTSNATLFSKKYIDYLSSVLANIDTNEISNFISTLLSARDRGATIFFAGNGGSAATASHFVNDLSIGINDYKKPFRAVSLTDNVPTVTAISNDFCYDEVFVRQLQIHGKEGDVLVGISASGNSSNLIKAIEYANESGIKTTALTAFDGGIMKGMANESVHIPTMQKEYGPAEDAHMMIDHLVSSYLMRFVKEG